MAFGNPPVPWSEVHRRLSGKPGPPVDGTRWANGGDGDERERAGRTERPTAPAGEGGGPSAGPPTMPEWADGGDSPAWSRKRSAYQAPADVAWRAGTVPYAELHCHTNFSFLDGASHPEELAEEAARLGLEALAVTDHDGFYGIVRFAEAARRALLFERQEPPVGGVWGKIERALAWVEGETPV